MDVNVRKRLSRLGGVFLTQTPGQMELPLWGEGTQVSGAWWERCLFRLNVSVLRGLWDSRR